jgi:hypothetical protein
VVEVVRLHSAKVVLRRLGNLPVKVQLGSSKMAKGIMNGTKCSALSMVGFFLSDPFIDHFLQIGFYRTLYIVIICNSGLFPIFCKIY